jgi:hypothetical protein
MPSSSSIFSQAISGSALGDAAGIGDGEAVFAEAIAAFKTHIVSIKIFVIPGIYHLAEFMQ